MEKEYKNQDITKFCNNFYDYLIKEKIITKNKLKRKTTKEKNTIKDLLNNPDKYYFNKLSFSFVNYKTKKAINTSFVLAILQASNELKKFKEVLKKIY